MQLEGKVALVTGAGSGIGQASALRFAAEGAAVVASDIRGSLAAETAEMIHAAGGRATSVKANVGEPADVERMVQRAVHDFGRLDVLFNNAATVRPGGALELSVEDWDWVWRTNVSSVFLGAKYAAPLMGEGSSIISTGSVSGLLADAKLIAYNASKGAVINLTRALATDLTPRGIRVNCLCPGITRTPPMEPLLSDERLAAMVLATLPARRFAEPDDIAAVAVFLASSAAAYITGQAIVVDGGMTTRHSMSILQQVRDHLGEDPAA